MFWMIDLPPPFGPLKESEETLASLLTIKEQDNPEVQSAVAEMREAIANRPAMGD